MSSTATTNIILPPNKQMDVTFDFSDNPQLYDYILFIDINSEGQCLLGSSDISGTFWEGTVLFYKDESSLLKFKHSKFFVHMTAIDGKFVNNETVAIAEDSGVLNILCIDDSATLKPMNYFRHIKQISEIAVWDNCSNILSCSGKALYIWDVNSNEKRPLNYFDSIHCNTVTSVDTVKTNKNVFFSASADRRACLWDLRSEERCPLLLYTNEFSTLTKVVVNPIDTNSVAIGTQAGDIYLTDARKPGDFISNYHCFSTPISCLAFNEVNQLGVGGNLNTILVFDTQENDLKEIYRDSQTHTGHVKDLKWVKDMLYSCGFGHKQLHTHKISY